MATNKMSRAVPFFLFILMAVACGKTKTGVDTILSLPIEMMQLDVSYDVTLTLWDPAGKTILWGPTELAFDPEANVWHTDLSDMDDAAYLASVDVMVGVGDQALILAQAGRAIELQKGAPSAAIAFRPLDFSTDFDADGDALPNLSEYADGLDPFLADSDSDGALDSIDAFPIDPSRSLPEEGGTP